MAKAAKKTANSQVKDGKRGSSPVDVYIGGRIRALRNAANMSQNELGDVLGVSFQQVQKYEKGVNRIAPARLMQIASQFRVDVTEMLDGAPTNGAMPKITNNGLINTRGLDLMMNDRIGTRMVVAFLKIEDANLRLSLTQLVESIVMADAS